MSGNVLVFFHTEILYELYLHVGLERIHVDCIYLSNIASVCLYDFTLFYLQILDPLLLTLRTAIENSPDPYKCEETTLALRFIRSVARVFVVLSSQMAPPNGKRKV